jgi:hypothetical protein
VLCRALGQEGDEFQIEARDFDAWVSDEARSMPGFSVEAAFTSVLQQLPDASEPIRGTGQAWPWTDPTTIRRGEELAWRDGQRMIVRVLKRETRPAPPPHEKYMDVLCDLAATAERSESRRLRIPRGEFEKYLSARILNHPLFDATRCFDRIVSGLSQPIDLYGNTGPRTLFGPPSVTIYTDGRDILVVPGRPLWMRIRWWQAMRRLHRQSPPEPDPG